MKQTPMQELKWFVSDGLDNYDESIKVSEIWNKINELLEKEKQVIEDVWENGNENITYDEVYGYDRTETFEDYYTETFKQK